MPAYESYDGSGYGSPASSRAHSMQWKQPPSAVNGHFDDFNFSTGDDRGNHAITLDTRVRSHHQDAVGRHLLYENAVLDSHDFHILDLDEVNALKKERDRLDARIEAANRKLAFENKVKDAVQNLHRLGNHKQDARPDTPQSPESLTKDRNSLVGSRMRTGSSTSQGIPGLHHSDEQVVHSIKKVDELNEQIKSFLVRRQYVESKLLKHIAAVMADQSSQAQQSMDEDHSSSREITNGDHGMYAFNDFDGIRDILHGMPPGTSGPGAHGNIQHLQAEHEEQLSSMQDRLEELNLQLRGVITEANRTRGGNLEPEPNLGPTGTLIQKLDSVFTRLEYNMRALESEQSESKAYYSHVQDSANLTQNTVEEQLERLNHQLHSSLVSSKMEAVHELRDPPQASGQGYQHQLQYLEETLFVMERILQQHDHSMSDNANNPAAAQKAAEYETVLAGLWELIASDAVAPRNSSLEESGARTPLREDFSLPAFNSRVQNLYDIATTSREQQDILRRQIQQQRDLNGKSDMEKDREIEEWQGRHDEISRAYQSVQDDLAQAMASHEQAERDASESRGELMNVANEVEQLRRTVDAKHQELETHRGIVTTLQGQVQTLEAQLNEHAVLATDKDASEQQHLALQKDMENLESEVVRLTTELTIAKADLEGAYGTRAQRQKEAGLQASEVAALQDSHQQTKSELESLQGQHAELQGHIERLRGEHATQTKAVQDELHEMTHEFQEMTRESLELEKERGQLEGLIDNLRERCDTLEEQLHDEKVKSMGVRTPGTPGDGPAKEMTSVMVLRQEFKKMMREARAEGVRLIKAEQEERRKLEGEIRKMRQAHGPLGRALHGSLSQNTTAGPASS